ncbi:transcriptional regulatory protein LEU3 [Exophiala viscosa]|uniref:transcriptional regulatory protein LEU3 n=1 Tax=Exophiala viscosa TaxID=2486360 RepID=UPI00219D1B4B|nr:transcriptional regulatory protein LEU3 [Exophiala viscosa]
MRGRKSNFVACVYCRQMKLACDGPQKFPSPCSRCTKAQRICSVDPAFKRTKRRERLTAVEKELQELKQTLNTREASSQPTHSTNHDTVIPPTGVLTPLEVQIPDLSLLSELPGVDLPEQEAQDLIKEYFLRYDSFCPILPDSSKFLEYAKPCPLLFWTVLVTALRGHPERKDLYSSIADKVRTMAYEAPKPTNVSLQFMQALLLLCQWPLPYLRMEDPSHAFAVLATQMGLRMGMHRPDHSFEYGFDSYNGGHELLRRKVWACCFTTNVSVSGGLGLPATIQLDHSLLQMSSTKPEWLPDTLYHQLHLSIQALNICNTLGSCESTSTGLLPTPLPVIRNFESELRALEFRFSTSWSPSDHIVLFGCRMILYTFALSIPDNDTAPTVEASSHWLVQAFMAASDIIRTASTIQEQLFYAPSRIQKILIHAVCYLLLVRCSPHRELVDNSMLVNGISQARQVVQTLSIATGDFMARAVRFIDRLSQYGDTMSRGSDTEPFFTIKSRMGANLSLTSLLRLRTYTKQAQAQVQDQTTAQDALPGNDVLNMGLDEDIFASVNWDELFLDMAALPTF